MYIDRVGNSCDLFANRCETLLRDAGFAPALIIFWETKTSPFAIQPIWLVRFKVFTGFKFLIELLLEFADL